MKQVYNGVDIVKFLGALCVMTYHALASAFGLEWRWFLLEHSIFRLAVPFFFVASGFFLGKKVRKNPEKRRAYFGAYLKRLAFLYAVWGSPAIALDLAYGINDGMSILQALGKVLHTTILLHNGVMWYMGALIFAAAVLYFMDTEKKLRISIWLGGAAFVVGMFLDSYSGIFFGSSMETVVNWYNQVFLSVNNGVFVGYFFTAVGYGYGACPGKERSLRYDLGIVVFGYAVFCVELLILSHIPLSLTGTYCSTLHMLILSPVLFRLAVRPWKWLPKETGFFRFSSTFMYFTHAILLSGLIFLFDLAPIAQYALMLVLELVAAAVVYRWNNPWINKLF